MTSSMPSWIQLTLTGICILAPAVSVSGFLISRDPVTGVERYDQPLRCTFRSSDILYSFHLYQPIMTLTGTYTARNDLDCCYKRVSRNHCCWYRDTEGEKCKCSSATTCGQAPIKRCADSFQMYKDSTCVSVIQERKSATDAMTVCKNLDPKKQGYLAVIKDAEYNNFIKSNVLGGITTNVWTGLRRPVGGEFGWTVNGVTTNLGTYTDWKINSPIRTEGFDCVNMEADSSWKWNNVLCGLDTNFALCQYDV